MTNATKYAWTFVLGGVCGGVATWLLLREHYEAIAEEDAEEVRKWARDHIKKAREEIEATTPKIKEEDDTKESVTVAGQTLYNKVKPDLRTLAAEAKVDTTIGAEESDDVDDDTDEEKFDPVEEVIERGPDPLTSDEDPFLISEEEFSGFLNPSGYEDFEKCQLTYYSGDDTLADEDDSILDPRQICGYDILDLLDGEDNKVIYVRNPRLGIDYEIEWVEHSFAEYVLGETDARVQKFRRAGRREEDD